MRVSWCLETSSIKTPFLVQISVPSSFVSLFIFYILSYLPSKTMGCFSGHLMTSASDQKLFCEVCSEFNYSFDEFVGENVVSPSYSSAILAPPCLLCLFGISFFSSVMFHVIWQISNSCWVWRAIHISTSSLSGMRFADIFSQCVVWLFLLFIWCFAEQIFNFDEAQFTNFSL